MGNKRRSLAQITIPMKSGKSSAKAPVSARQRGGEPFLKVDPVTCESCLQTTHQKERDGKGERLQWYKKRLVRQSGLEKEDMEAGGRGVRPVFQCKA